MIRVLFSIIICLASAVAVAGEQVQVQGRAGDLPIAPLLRDWHSVQMLIQDNMTFLNMQAIKKMISTAKHA